MAAPARSLQALCRAAFSLCNSASTSARAAAPAVPQLGGGGGLWSAGGGQAAVPGALLQLARQFHTSPGHHAAAAGDATPVMNPLQQAPAPVPGAGASPLGPDVILAGGDVTDTSRAVSRGMSISPRKLNDFAKLVRGMHIEDALIQCAISPKKSSKLVQKALLSAKANAVNNFGLEPHRLRVAEAWVGKGVHLKRTSMHGRGRSGQRLRYRSHLTVVLREEVQEPRRHTKILPMLAEREKWQQATAPGAAAAAAARPEP